MIIWIVIAAAAWIGICLIVLAMCRLAALGDAVSDFGESPLPPAPDPGTIRVIRRPALAPAPAPAPARSR